MAIKISGLNSNLDTDSIVQALVSAYSVKKDNLVKAQTKLAWTQDAWQSMNTKIYDFYTKSLSNMRLVSTYAKKSAAITGENIAQITASSAAVVGSQTLQVKSLAASGYLTGGVVTLDSETAEAGAKVKGSSKLREIKGMASFTSGNISVLADGKQQDIEITGDMSVNEFLTKLKEAGVNASFDEQNQRFFISAKTSGKAGDFALTAQNTSGLSALQSLGLYTQNAADKQEYEKWANYSQADLDRIIKQQFEESKTNFQEVEKEYADKYKAAQDTITDLNKKNEEIQKTIDELEIQKGNGTLTDADRDAIDKKIEEAQAQKEANAKSIETQQAVVGETEPYVNGENKEANINAQVKSRNDKIESDIKKAVQDKVDTARAALASSITSEGAVRIIGSDASIVLNGAEFTSNTNSFSINGLTIQVTGLSKTTDPTTITVGTDTDGIYNTIQSFLKEYNTLVNTMNTAFNAPSAKGYDPLTADEKSAMTDKQAEEWEKKIKDSLLRKDGTLGGVISSVKSDMMSTFTIDGETISLATYGINTLSFFQTSVNDRGQYHIDGDKEDSSSSGKTDKLREAIAQDPDKVMSFFTQLANKTYTDLSNRMKTSTIKSAYKVYNDKQMAIEYSSYTSKIKDQETKVADMEEYYYRRFTQMEQALARLNSNTSSLSQLLGN